MLNLIHHIQNNYFPLALIVCLVFTFILLKGRFTYKVYCVLLLLSVGLTCLSVPLFHKHFYGWGIQYFEHRKNIILTNMILNRFITHPEIGAIEDLLDGMMEFDETTLVDDLNYYHGDRVQLIKYSFTHHVKIKKDDELVFLYESGDLPVNSVFSTIILQKKNCTIEMSYYQPDRSWLQTVNGYLKALARGEILYSKWGLIKYTDFFLLNIAIFTALIALYTHLRYRDGVKVAKRFDKLIYDKYKDS